MLRVVAVEPYCCCMPWHARSDGDHGGTCWFCNRSIAVPERARRKLVACIYCGMDRGFIPEKEIEP